MENKDLVLSGNLSILINGFLFVLDAGDVIYLPHGTEFTLQSNSPFTELVEVMPTKYDYS